ncbi:MAG: hypothetical protein H6876_10660 [Hyphomicrobiaceae bacterium]|nr:hypothetical protein [Hyphomicrobiaceae bacterium]MCC0008563.1 hypothetical protein [Hyphomicrobiaceae bacterium]
MFASSKVSGSVWGRIADYIFGRNSLIGIASLMLLTISGYATWSGMNDFIIGVSQSPGAAQGREIIGGLSVTNNMLVIAIVVALTFLMWLALRESFAAKRVLRDRMLTFPLYFFLALWSIGFGYGFWWSLIAGEEATRSSLSGLQEDARDAATAIAARLDAVKVQLDSVVSWSDGQMAREETSGGSCGVASGAGRGPLYNARRSVRDSIASLRDNVTTAWIGPVQQDVEKLRQAASQLAGETVAERQQAFEATAARIRGTARAIAARSNELGRSTATEMRAIASAVTVAPKQPGFSCYDPTLGQRLNQAAEQADQPAVLNLRDASFSEGPAGVANAVKALWENMGSYTGSLWRYVVSGGSVSGDSTVTGRAITGRDLIALLATVGIDLGLFVLTALNPPPAERKRFAPETVRQIQDAMRTAAARAPGTDIEWVRKHFLHHYKDSYFVIPNLYSADPDVAGEADKALAMNQLSGVLDDLGLIRWPHRRPRWQFWGKDELDKLREEESMSSKSALVEARKEWMKDNPRGYTKEEQDEFLSVKDIRNHGVFSKADRMLENAGWSKRARNDIEVFVFEDVEGLTPLLDALNDMQLPGEADGSDASLPRTPPEQPA